MPEWLGADGLLYLAGKAHIPDIPAPTLRCSQSAAPPANSEWRASTTLGLTRSAVAGARPVTTNWGSGYKPLRPPGWAGRIDEGRPCKDKDWTGHISKGGLPLHAVEFVRPWS